MKSVDPVPSNTLDDATTSSLKKSSSFSSFVSEGHTKKGFSRVYVSAALSIFFVMVAIVNAVSMDSPATDGQQPHRHGTSRRGKFVGETFDAKDLYDAYKEVETEYHAKAFRSNNWRVLAGRDQVEVSLMEHPSDPSCPYVKMVAVVPAPVQECWNWLSLHNWPTNMPKMDPFYEDVELHGNFDYKGVHMILARKRTKRILAFGKRDMVFLSVSDQPLPDGTWVSGSVSVQTPQLPRQHGYTRAFQDSIAFYKPLENNSKCRLTIVCRIDLNDSSEDGSGGWIPMWIYVKTIGATGVRSVSSMRDVIVKDKEIAEAEAALQQSSQTPEGTKEDRTLFSFWEQRIGRRGQSNDDLVIPTPMVQNTASSTSSKRRWNLPWSENDPVGPVVEQNAVSPDVGRHRVPRFFFKR